MEGHLGPQPHCCWRASMAEPSARDGASWPWMDEDRFPHLCSRWPFLLCPVDARPAEEVLHRLAGAALDRLLRPPSPGHIPLPAFLDLGPPAPSPRLLLPAHCPPLHPCSCSDSQPSSPRDPSKMKPEWCPFPPLEPSRGSPCHSV